MLWEEWNFIFLNGMEWNRIKWNTFSFVNLRGLYCGSESRSLQHLSSCSLRAYRLTITSYLLLPLFSLSFLTDNFDAGIRLALAAVSILITFILRYILKQVFFPKPKEVSFHLSSSVAHAASLLLNLLL